MKELPRRKIRFNVWRDPTPKPVDYLSPHCASGNCNYCAERRRRKRQAATDAANAEAAKRPEMFWDSPIFPGTKWDLGPSAPSSWKQTYVKPPPGPHAGDVLGYWPAKPWTDKR